MRAKRRIFTFLMLVLLMGLMSVTAYAQGIDENEFADEIIRLVNIERAREGLDPFTINSALTQAADIRARELRRFWGHKRADGTTHWSTVLDEVQFVADSDPTFAGVRAENLGVMWIFDCVAPEDVSQAIADNIDPNIIMFGRPGTPPSGWMNSPGHRAPIMSQRVNAMGVSVYRHTYRRVYVVKVFGRVAPATLAQGGDTEGGGAGGIAGADTTVLTLPQQQPLIDSPPAATLAQNANSAAGQDVVRSRHNDKHSVSAAEWAAMAGTRFEHDTLDGSSVGVRLVIGQPERIAQDTMVSAWVSGADVNRVRTSFERSFTNNMRVVHLDHSEAWGQTVRVAARVDLTGMNTQNLVFYSFNSETNTYRIIAAPDYRIDSNGFLRFNTDVGGSIIISDGQFVRR